MPPKKIPIISGISVSCSPDLLPAHERLGISSVRDAHQAFRGAYSEALDGVGEELKIMYLDGGNGLLGIHTRIWDGSSDMVSDIQEVLAIGLGLDCKVVITAHSHPSTGLASGQGDTRLTVSLAHFQRRWIGHTLTTSFMPGMDITVLRRRAILTSTTNTGQTHHNPLFFFF